MKVQQSINIPSATADYSELSRKDNTATLDDYVAQTLKQIDTLTADEIIIVAHSAGGVIGTEIAKRLGDRLAGFVAISALLPKPGTSFVANLPFPQKKSCPYF